ncbi:hypothetical protein GCM10027610_026550 [Dactylosporangium cerinum]
MQNVHTIFANLPRRRLYARSMIKFSGFWALLTGGAAIAVLLAVLDPITRPEDCANYGGNGNASAFDNPGWDLGFSLVLVCWLAAIAVEQTLPVTRRHRGGVEVAARALGALTLAVVASCYLFLQVAVLCH